MPTLLKSKTFWAGIGFVCLGIYHVTQEQYDQATQAFLAALTAWGLRHSVAKNTTETRCNCPTTESHP